MATAADGPQSLIPGLEEEAALLCLARVPRAYHKTLRQVCHQWRQLVDYPGTPPVTRREVSSCEAATLPPLQLEPSGEPSTALASSHNVSDVKWELKPHSISGTLTLCPQPNTAYSHTSEKTQSSSVPHLQRAQEGAVGSMAGRGSLQLSATAPLSATSSSDSMSEGQGDLEGHVQKQALYQVRRLEGIAETWIYLRTRTSSFVNHWRYFDVTNGVWAPRLPEIPYIAAAVAERSAAGSPHGAFSSSPYNQYSPYSTAAERSPYGAAAERGAMTPQHAVPWFRASQSSPLGSQSSPLGSQGSPFGSPYGSPMPRPVADMNKVRGLGSAAVGRRIYVFGGWREGGPALTDMFCYDAVTERWSRRAPMLTPRCYMATAVIGNRIYVAGGMTRPRLHLSELLTSAEYYDVDADRWHALPDMPCPLFFTFAVELSGKLFVSGNGIQTALDGADPGRGCVLDPVHCTWTLMKDQRVGDAILCPCAAVGRWLFAVCGNSIQALDSVSGEWFSLSVRQPQPRAGNGTVTGAVTGAVTGVGAGAGAGSGEGGAGTGETVRGGAGPGEDKGEPAPGVAAAKHTAAAASAAAAREAAEREAAAVAAAAERALLSGALKDCAYAGSLSGVEGGRREGEAERGVGGDGEVCSLALLQRSGAITRVDIRFLKVLAGEDPVDWGLAHCRPAARDVARTGSGAARGGADVASLDFLRGSKRPIPIHPRYTKVCTVCFDARPGEATPQGYLNHSTGDGHVSASVGGGVDGSGGRGSGQGAGGAGGAGEAGGERLIEIPFVARVASVSKGPPLDDEQPVNIALVCL